MARKVGSGGQRRKGLAGRGPTPRAEDRVYHKAYRDKKAASSGGGRQSGRGGRPSSHGRGAGADWVVGRNPVLEAMQAGMPIKTAYVAEGSERDTRLREIFKYAADNSISLLQTSRAELDRLTGGAVHQGVALQLPGYDYLHPDDLLADALHDQTKQALVIALDGITDPHNLGAIIRSAAAFGAHGVVIPERRSASVTAVAWKASAGALARVPVAMAVNLNRTLSDYAKAGFTVAGLAGEGETDIAGIPGVDGPLVVVIGSEGDGLARLTRERCDLLARIPITSQIESLNASVAAGIALYEVARCRGELG
ncbi:MAG: 23S rRNA (guanosine(2251)-2'-O)-methyltransferase RlmB [Brooklawnia sp.]|jgi:23S rRNA (guanosine2251-2'-O)-methyltransferase